MEDKTDVQKIMRLLSSFPLRVSELKADMSLGSSIDLFGSLMIIRVESYLSEEFPSVIFNNLSSQTTYLEICEQINSQMESLKNNPIRSKVSTGQMTVADENNNLIYRDGGSRFISVGIDIESIEALPKTIFSLNSCGIRKKLFTTQEIMHAIYQQDPRLTLLGIYCAKEAIIKSSPSWIDIPYSEIEIRYYENGKPYSIIETQDYLIKYEISISHSKEYACAMSICRLPVT